jgi:hypothetical protein
MQYPDPSIPQLTTTDKILLAISIIESDRDDIEALRAHVSRGILAKLSNRELCSE